MAKSQPCKTCSNPILKAEGGNLLMNTHCSRLCYEKERQGLLKAVPPVIRVESNCVLCGDKTILTKRRPNAWLCGQPCNIRKSQIFGRKSNKKYLILLCLQLHGSKTASQLADFLGQIYTRYRFHHAGVSQMLAGFVAKGTVIKHKHPTNPDKRGATYQIEHQLPLENLAPVSL